MKFNTPTDISFASLGSCLSLASAEGWNLSFSSLQSFILHLYVKKYKKIKITSSTKPFYHYYMKFYFMFPCKKVQKRTNKHCVCKKILLRIIIKQIKATVIDFPKNIFSNKINVNYTNVFQIQVIFKYSLSEVSSWEIIMENYNY